eukprot:TRINITY_DN69383_c0_g1_i1.p1 TRINITY_DN69383_c0_g1~~TRINITY_DN69383_c0_g1_i1.p1  ORF type:complete len:596 (-),score=96.66 TRINITY_DN69383_c0_g1_i1:44-1831(-)
MVDDRARFQRLFWTRFSAAASLITVAVVLCVVPSSVNAQPQPPQWPDCKENGVVYRHNHAYGIFIDLTEAVGAKEGCWQDNCLKSDKFVCPSAEECASACMRVDACRFWTYEPGIVKCFLRSSDAGREVNADFVSGSRACRPVAAGDSLGQSSITKVPVPFAAAALWAAELPAIQGCKDGIGSAGCDNPFGAMGVVRYAVNNLRAALSRLPEAEKLQQKEVYAALKQIASDVAAFFKQPTPQTFQFAISNTMHVIDALRGWLKGSPLTLLEMDHSDGRGAAPHLPGGRSAVIARERGVEIGRARVRLSDGREMPLLGFGTWQLNGQAVYDATIAAIQAGYRHIDTAQAYMNERELGFAIRDAGVPRSDLFIATKISDPDEFPRLEERLRAQLEQLRTDYVDVYMLHSPGDKAQREAAWRTMERFHDQGIVRSLGVSNFGRTELEELLAFARVKPVYIQNKFSIYNPGEQQVGPASMSAYAKENGMQMTAYSVINPWPFLLPPMEDPHVLTIAHRYGKTAAQVLHRWALQLGAAVIPKSKTATRIVENGQIFDFELTEPDMRLLNGLVCLSESTYGSPVKPSWGDDVYGLGRISDL